MATQDSGHPPTLFSISTPFQAVRLIEAPDDLIEIVASSNPSKLKFKSAPPRPKAMSTTTTTTQQSQSASNDGILHLCADGKAWAVKQVSTSNSVYVIQPTEPPAREPHSDFEDDTEMADADTDANEMKVASYGAVTAVAQVGHFLELHPVKINEAEIERAIVELLPVWHPVKADEDVDLDLQASNDAKSPVSLQQLIDDIPAPDEVVVKACARLGVFESARVFGGNEGNGARCVIPSTRALLDVWTALVEGSTIEGIRLDSTISVVRLAKVSTDELESTIIERMFEDGGLFNALNLFEEDTKKLRPVKTCRFIAGLITTSERHPKLELNKFQQRWTDLVPASFVKFCTAESLTSGPSSTFKIGAGENGDDVVEWTGQRITTGVVLVPALVSGPRYQATGFNDSGNAEATSKPAGGPAGFDKKRKWHEKFGAQRNRKQ